MKKTTQDTEIIDELLERSVKEILPSKDSLREKLLSGERLRMYIGTDATGTSLHLGHATNYLILEKFRKLGHEVIFLIGDFTSRIGDPTDKGDAARKQLTREDVVAHTQTWLSQISPIIDIHNADNPVKILYNHEWLSVLTFEDIINLSANFTVQQMIERDMFQVRLKEGKPLYLHELFYPLMQGYDSVAMDVDIEICGSDQTFNALAGRTLLKKLKNKEKFVFVTNLLENPKTHEKMMSKSQGTGVFLDYDAPKMYGGIMAQPDENMRQLFVDCTRLSRTAIENLFETTPNLRDLKMKLAFEITEMYHGKDGAKEGETYFVDTFQKKAVPQGIEDITAPYVDKMVQSGLVSSKSELRRLLASGSIKDADSHIKIESIPEHLDAPLTLKIGKQRFIRLVP